MLSNFDFAKSRSISEIGFQIFACELKIYTFTILIQQHGVSPHSIIDSPPPPTQRICTPSVEASHLFVNFSLKALVTTYI